MSRKIKDITGYIYGNWRVIEYSHRENTSKGTIHYWLCKHIKTEEVKVKSTRALCNAQYQKTNPKLFSAYALDYYYKNKEKCLKQMREYYENNLERLKEYGRQQQKQWKKDHPKYYIENKEKFKEYNKRHQQKKAKLKLQNAVRKGILSRVISSLFNKGDIKNV